MVEIKDVIGWAVAIILAILGVSSIKFYRKNKNKNTGNTINQSVTGDNNKTAAGDISITVNKEE